MNELNILRLYLDSSYNIHFFASKGVFIICLISVFILLAIQLIRYYIFDNVRFSGDIDISEASIGIGSGKITLKPNYDTIQIAYKLWTELNTRKLGLPIDPDNDVLVEIYNSWHEFFKITRELIKEIPAEKARKKETKKIIEIATDVLNKGVRPHLTKWQARYRSWYQSQITNNVGNLSPQEIQKNFVCANDEFCYTNLITDMLAVNNRLIEYNKVLERIVFGKVKEI